MSTWVALLRGINVGGNNILPMARLVEDLEQLGLQAVRTYIQSGNVVFEFGSRSASNLGRKIRRQIEQQHGFKPHVLILSEQELRRAVSENPFPEAVSEPKSLHFFFLAEVPDSPQLGVLEQTKAESEGYVLSERVFYLHTPAGLGRSKLGAKVEKALGVPATARNYRTVDKLMAMVGDN